MPRCSTRTEADGHAAPNRHQIIHSAHRRLGSSRIPQLVADHQAGAPITELMKTYGIGKGTVLDLLEREGIPRRRNKGLTPKQTEGPGDLSLPSSGGSVDE